MKLLLLAFIFITSFVYAGTTRIHDIWEPETSNESYLVLTIDGRVHEVETSDKKLLETLQAARKSNHPIELHFENAKSINNDDSRKVISHAELVSSVAESNYEDTYVENIVDIADPMAEYIPTIVSSMSVADQYFNTMRTRDRRKSQCYNRAYVWSYELWQNHQVKSTKVWMFFTKKYIREFRYHWWFHVTPAIEVAGEPELITMDRKYMRGPTPLTEWKDFFIRNQAHCPMIRKYSDYRDNQYSEYCYHIQSSMYFWQPFQIENLERRNWDLRKKYVYNELRVAYRNGFGLRVQRVGQGQDYAPRPVPRRRRWWNPRRWF